MFVVAAKTKNLAEIPLQHTTLAQALADFHSCRKDGCFQKVRLTDNCGNVMREIERAPDGTWRDNINLFGDG